VPVRRPGTSRRAPRLGAGTSRHRRACVFAAEGSAVDIRVASEGRRSARRSRGRSSGEPAPRGYAVHGSIDRATAFGAQRSRSHAIPDKVHDRRRESPIDSVMTGSRSGRTGARAGVTLKSRSRVLTARRGIWLRRGGLPVRPQTAQIPLPLRLLPLMLMPVVSARLAVPTGDHRPLAVADPTAIDLGAGVGAQAVMARAGHRSPPASDTRICRSLSSAIL
jgi:hypothetical protein